MGRGRTGTGVDARKDCIRVRFTWQGVRRSETLNLKPTQANIRAAERLVAQIKAEIAIGAFDYLKHFPTSQKVRDTKSFERYADLYYDTLMLTRSTKVTYGNGVRRWKTVFAGRDIADIKPSDISAAIAAMNTRLAGSTINAYMSVLRGIIAVALDDGALADSPARRIKTLRNQRDPPDPLSPEEIQMVLAHLEKHSPQVAAFYEFAFYTGLRPSEQIALRWGRIDWHRKTATIDTAHVLGADTDTKTHKSREIDLHADAISALTRMKAHTWLRGLDGHVFINPATRKPWRNNETQRKHYWAPALKACGLRQRDAYQTRHTYATMLLMAGIHPAYIAKQLGHASVKTTLTHYARWVDATDKGQQAQKVNDVIGRVLVAKKPKAPTSLGE